MSFRASCRRTRIWAPSLSLLLCACAEGIETTAGTPRLARPRIVLISVDTLRADHVGCYGYIRPTTPAIDQLAREATLFENAFCTQATTLPSHASMLTALYPREHGIDTNGQSDAPLVWKRDVVSFAQVARDDGFATAGFVSAAPLKSSPVGIAAGFDTWDEPAGRRRRGEQTVSLALRWLAERQRGPYFLLVHLFDPHWPRDPQPPYDAMFATDAALEAWTEERAFTASLPEERMRPAIEAHEELNAYCAEIRYADEQVGRLLAALRGRRDWKYTTVIVTSDHGDGINQHGWQSHGLVWEEHLRVPLIIRFPGERASRFEPVVSLVDLFPTVLGRFAPLATPLLAGFLEQASGVDVLAESFVERPVFAQRTARDLEPGVEGRYALTARDWKLIHAPDAGSLFFERGGDPHELRDAGAERSTDLQRALDELSSALERQERRGTELSAGGTDDQARDPEVLGELEALGYAGYEDEPSAED